MSGRYTTWREIWKRAQELRREDSNVAVAIGGLCPAIAFCSDADAVLREAGAGYLAKRERALKVCLQTLVELEDQYLEHRAVLRKRKQEQQEKSSR